MDGTLQSGMHAVWAQCWQVTLLILGVWLTVRLCARNRPHLASVLWLVVLIKCVTPPLWSSPSSVFSWLQPSSMIKGFGESTPAWVLAQRATKGDHVRHDDIVVQISRPDTQLDSSLPTDMLAEPPSAFAAWIAWSNGMGRTSPWIGWMIAAWTVGCVGFASIAALRCARCWQRLRRAGEINAPQVTELADKLRRLLGLRRPVRVLVSRSPVGPAVVGLFRPTVILPAILVESRTLNELEPLLAHELVHIRRGDLWVGLLQLLTRGVWWFHPLVRVANSLLTREAERCCDEEVIALLGCEPGRYARSLIDVLALKRTLQPIPEFPGVRPVDVTSQRLERIMKLGQGCHKRTPRWCWAVMLLAVAATLPGAAFIVAEDEPQSNAAKAAVPAVKRESTTTPAEQVTVITGDINLIIEEEEELLGTGGSETHVAKIQEKNPDSVSEPGRVTVVCNARDVIQKMKSDLYSGDEEARKQLIEMLMQTEQGAASKRAEEAARGNKSSDSVGNSPNEPELRLSWHKDQLVISYSEKGIRRVLEQLRAMGEDGFQQLVIETRMITGPEARIANIPADWKMLELGAATPKPDANADEFPAYVNTRSGKPGDSSIQGRIEAVVEKHHPAMLALTDSATIQTIVKRAQADPRTNLLWAPKVTLLNGQTATIQDSIQRPFVTAIQRTSGGYSSTVRKFDEGWILRCRPKLQHGGDAVRLDLHLTLSEIRSVETTSLPAVKDLPGAVIQIPELATTRIRTQVDMALGQTLVIGGLTDLTTPSSDSKTRQPFMVLVQVRNVTPEKETKPVAVTTSTPVTSAVVTASGTTVEGKADVLAANLPQSTLKAEPQPQKLVLRTENSALETRVYNVADLVIPLQESTAVYSEDESNTVSSFRRPNDKADFEPLMEMMTTTVEPDTWDIKGGSGSVRPFKKTLSLVIRQTAAVHESIQNLLAQLRHLQDLQASYHLERLEICQPEFEYWAKKKSEPLAAEVANTIKGMTGPLISVNRQAVGLLRDGDGVKWQRSGPKVTLFNGQPMELQLTRAGANAATDIAWLRLNPVMSADLRLFRVNVAGGTSADDKVKTKNNELITMPCGQSLLIDLSQQSWTDRRGLAILKKVPYVNRLFENTSTIPAPATRQFYLITPRIILVQEEVAEPANAVLDMK